MQVFAMINKDGIMINTDVKVKKVNVMADLFGILVYVNVNLINHVILENI